MGPIYHKEILNLLKYFEKTLQAFLRTNDDIKNGSSCRIPILQRRVYLNAYSGCRIPKKVY